MKCRSLKKSISQSLSIISERKKQWLLLCFTLKSKTQGEQEGEGPRDGEGEVEKESEIESEKSWSFISTFIILFKPFFLKKSKWR